MCRFILKETHDLFPPVQEKMKDLTLTNTFRSGPLSLRSNSSQRSKYLSNSKLTRPRIFSTIQGKKTAEKD